MVVCRFHFAFGLLRAMLLACAFFSARRSPDFIARPFVQDTFCRTAPRNFVAMCFRCVQIKYIISSVLCTSSYFDFTTLCSFAVHGGGPSAPLIVHSRGPSAPRWRFCATVRAAVPVLYCALSVQAFQRAHDCPAFCGRKSMAQLPALGDFSVML